MESAAHMPSGWMALVWGIITFSLLVIVHEGGHFLAARLFKIKVHEFMIGLPGPALRYRSKRTGISYGVTAVPMGGYVRIAGMEPGEEDPRLGEALALIVSSGEIGAVQIGDRLELEAERVRAMLTTLEDMAAVEAIGDSGLYRAIGEAADPSDPTGALDRARALTYRGRPTWKRVVVLSAGVVFNLVAAFLIFTLTLSIWGYQVPSTSLTVGEVIAGTPADRAGLRTGDRILRVEGTRLTDWDSLVNAVRSRQEGERVALAVQRDGVPLTISVTLARSGEGNTYLGVAPKEIHRRFTVIAAARESLSWTALVFVAIADFFNPRTFAQSVAGARSVVGISYEVARAAEAGPIQYAWMVAFLSLSLGAMNLLPLPPLDGGKVLVELIERIRRRPLKREFTYAMSAVGAVLLFSLIFYLMYADVMRYIVRG